MIDLHLDLMTQDNYLSSLALLRQKITNGRMKKNLPCALRIAVQLPDGKAELFIQSSNLYLIGFLGGNNKVLTLEMQVSRSEDLAEALIRNSGRLDKGEQIVKSGLGADHAALGR